MNSRPVRYLFFLIVLILGAQGVTYHPIGKAHANSRHARQSDRVTMPTLAMILLFPTGPFILFAIAGLFIFRRSSVALWGLVTTASAFALLTLAVLLCEYRITIVPIQFAERGSRYMNCAGDPFTMLFLLTVPLTAIALVVPTILHLADATFQSLGRAKQSHDPK